MGILYYMVGDTMKITNKMKSENKSGNVEELRRFLYSMESSAVREMLFQAMLYLESREYLWNCVREYTKAYTFKKSQKKEEKE